jgi:hypothetical protein
MYGFGIIERTLSQLGNVTDKTGRHWQYFSRSDHHSKTGCWAILFDLLRTSSVLRDHVAQGLVGFGINHRMTDFRQDKSKDLDLVLCRPLGGASASTMTFAQLARKYNIALTPEELEILHGLPAVRRVPVGSVLVALEAKATMTAHVRALPRLYDELNSSHSIVHGHDQTSIAAGLAMVNIATRFISPDLNKVRAQPLVYSDHRQPQDAESVIATIERLRRRANTGEEGFDALAIVVVDCANDGTAASVLRDLPAPAPGSNFHYDSLIHRVCHIYHSRFPQA